MHCFIRAIVCVCARVWYIRCCTDTFVGLAVRTGELLWQDGTMICLLCAYIMCAMLYGAAYDIRCCQ